MAVPRVRGLIAGFSLSRSGFAPNAVHVGFVVDKMALGQVSSLSPLVACHYHSTAAPYSFIHHLGYGKWTHKKLIISSRGTLSYPTTKRKNVNYTN
jgi:hypothetical protein